MVAVEVELPNVVEAVFSVVTVLRVTVEVELPVAAEVGLPAEVKTVLPVEAVDELDIVLVAVVVPILQSVR